MEWSAVGPVPVSRQDTRISLLGTTTVTGNQVVLTGEGSQLRAALDTDPLTVGSWRVGIRLTLVAAAGDDVIELDGSVDVYGGESDPIEVLARTFATGDDIAITLKRASVPPTTDQALWARIRNSTNAMAFNRYSAFLEVVMCGESPEVDGPRRLRHTRRQLHKLERRTALPFPNVDPYRLLKAATEVFLMVHCSVDLDDFSDVDLDEEGRRLNRTIRPGDLESQMRKYLTRVSAGDGEYLKVLPYMGLIRQQLRDVPIVGVDDDDEAVNICQGIIAEKLTHQCFLELIWSYWLEEGRLAAAIDAVAWRFQNPTAARGRDPLAALEIDPLRPLNNLLWGWIQDTQHRLTAARRAYEYDHEYGLVLASKPGPPVRGAGSRSRFVDAFHNLLSVCAEFFMRDDDTTVIADGFGVLNALRETHIILTQGAHNTYGDLSWTARHEMLMTQWILARPEMGEFLPTRGMVVEPEPWMSRVEAMNKLQGWSDPAVLHFRDLAVFGEQLLLSIRFGNWTVEDQPNNAANWARYWRSEIQRYVYAYRAVTGVDLIRQADL